VRSTGVECLFLFKLSVGTEVTSRMCTKLHVVSVKLEPFKQRVDSERVDGGTFPLPVTGPLHCDTIERM
jgi:hypothetical protein